MIYFNKFNEDKREINFGSTEDAEITAKIIDDHTGLVTYTDRFKVSSCCQYTVCHFKPIRSRRFEITNANSGELLLMVNAFNPDAPSIEEADKLGRLRSLNYLDSGDSQPGLALYEIFATRIYDNNIKIEPGDIVFDIGANLGLFSYYAIGEEAKEVHAFEPSPDAAAFIKSKFDFKNLKIIESAVCDRDGEIEFNINPKNSLISSIQLSSEDTISVKRPAVKLSTYIKENKIDQIDYLKIDCEGSEYDIIEDIPTEFLTNNIKKIALEYHQNTGGKLQRLIDRLTSCGFDIRFEFSPNQINDELGMLYAAKSFI